MVIHNQGSDSGHSRFDVGSGYYGEPYNNYTILQMIMKHNNNDYDDPGFQRCIIDQQKIDDYKTSLGQMDDASWE